MKILNLLTENKDYPIAGSIVSGLKVTDNIPNLDSISATLDDYKILDRVREIPLSIFELTGKSYSVSETNRIKKLAEEISNNQWIDPIIVVVDNEGPYILEGYHRAEALYRLDKKSIPALIVIDHSA